jgi:hypothetical protein
MLKSIVSGLLLGFCSLAMADVSNSEMNQLSQNAPHLNKQALQFALQAYHKAMDAGDVKNPTLTVIDYSVPSNQPRMWIFNMNTDALLFKTFVAHGKNSGQSANATQFSNNMSSKESSLGTFITEDTYNGHKGYSLHLKGLVKGFNDNALERHVVVHGAWYVNPDFIKQQGRAGASWGCPAIATNLAKPVIDTIKNGSVVFSYYPSPKFIQAISA